MSEETKDFAQGTQEAAAAADTATSASVSTADKATVNEEVGMAVEPAAVSALAAQASTLAATEEISYTKKTWADGSTGGTPITADELNRMEEGINSAVNGVNELGDFISQKLDDLIIAYKTGNIIIVNFLGYEVNAENVIVGNLPEGWHAPYYIASPAYVSNDTLVYIEAYNNGDIGIAPYSVSGHVWGTLVYVATS